jgi:hypothetical protein
MTRIRFAFPALALLLLVSAGGCNRQSANGDDSQSGSSSSGSASSKQANQQQKGGGGSGNELKEPNDSTTGENSNPVAADSDDGSPRAVTKTPNAMPGAPVATTKDKPQDSPESPAASSPHPR